MTLRTTSLTAALALAITAGGAALAQQAVTIAPAPQEPETQQTPQPAAIPPATEGQATPAPGQQTQAPAAEDPAAPAPASEGQATPAPVEAGSGQTPTGESATAPTQSSEPTSEPAGGELTPMEAPQAPTATATDGDTAAEAPAGEAAPAEAAAEASAEEPAAAEGAVPATEGAAAGAVQEPAADSEAGAAAEDGAQAPQGAGEQAADAVGLTEGEEAAVPAETTGTVVAVERHDEVEGQAAGGESHGGGDHGAGHIEDIAFSFEGPFGTFDQFQLQRGLQVYTEVCAACHGLKFVPIRTLHDDGGPGLPEDQVRAYAAALTPILDPETGEERPRLPTDHFPTVTGLGMGPDLSLMAKARAGFHGPYGTGINQLLKGIGGPEYIHAILTSYTGEQVEQAGAVLYENTAFPGGYIGMPPPLTDDAVTYQDGTPATADQMARDVAAYLMWTAEPKLTDRKQVGLVAVLFLIVLTSLLYLTNKRLWAPHKGKNLHR